MFTNVKKQLRSAVYNCKKLNVYICEMKKAELSGLAAWHASQDPSILTERKLTLSDLEPLLRDLSPVFGVSVLGHSYESRPIYKVVLGSGRRKILIWTQMHGNESTGTKAVLDFFRWIENPGNHQGLKDELLKRCTICVVPMLNPDGAERYTRLDSRGIDLNRDVLEKKAPESLLLQEVLKAFDPHYCFNMHDQRTIFSVGSPPKPATLSFLAPSEDEERSLTEGRIGTMEVIAAMFNALKGELKGRIGRYTDEFYPAATGDNFQRMGYSTVLIESGHFPDDYPRKQTRKYTFLALVSGLVHIARDLKANFETYFEIPDNEKFYLDRIVKNVKIGDDRGDLGIYLKETLVDGQLQFKPTLDRFGDLSGYGADQIVSGDHLTFSSREDAENWLAIEFI
jgi:hypothetical protein